MGGDAGHRRGGYVIEDNAQCFLGSYKGRLVGSIGEFASFSFQASKHMTCGDGGILDDDLHGTESRDRHEQVLRLDTELGSDRKSGIVERSASTRRLEPPPMSGFRMDRAAGGRTGVGVAHVIEEKRGGRHEVE